MTVLLSVLLFASGVLLGAFVTITAQLFHVKRPNLSLVGTTGTTAQVPPSRATSDYPYKPFYPSPEEEANLGRSPHENFESHEPMEASRR